MTTALLISVQGIGNTVLVTPIIAALSENGSQVDVVVSNNGSHEVLQQHGSVRRLYLWKEEEGSLQNLLRLRAELRRQSYDVAYALYPNGKRENVLLWLAHAARKVRYAWDESRYRLLDFLPATEKMSRSNFHDLTNNLHLVQGNGSDPSQRLPHVHIGAESTAFARDFVRANNLALKFIVAIHPGGGGPAKRWAIEKYRALAAKLIGDETIRILVFGNANERELVETVTRDLGDRGLAVCALQLEKAAAIMALSNLFVGNDSALAHIASALELPAIVIWGYTDFRRVAPLNPKAVLVRMNYSCNPCYQFAKGYIEDCQYHLKCIKDIPVDQVYRIVTQYISLLRDDQTLANMQTLVDELGTSPVEQLESGCLKIDLNGAEGSSVFANA